MQAFLEAGCIGYTQDMAYLVIGQGVGQKINRNSLFTGDGLQRIGAGKIHQFGVGDAEQRARGNIDGNTRIVGYPLAQAGETIKQRTLARVWTTQQQYPVHGWPPDVPADSTNTAWAIS